MFYTQEESAVLGGFLSSYLNRDSASDHVRDAFARFQVGLERGCLQKSELQWAEQMLLALKPLWWEEWEDHRALMSVLLKTQALLRADSLPAGHGSADPAHAPAPCGRYPGAG